MWQVDNKRSLISGAKNFSDSRCLSTAKAGAHSEGATAAQGFAP